MDWRLGGDLGTNSLGTAVFSLGADGIDDVVHLGSRIFSDGRDPKSRASSNMDRRQARLMARGYERRSRRKESLLRLLTRLGLAPADRAARAIQAAFDPYGLRAKGLDHDLTATEFGRVLTSLNRRRGFKSSRLDSDEDEAESGMIATGIGALEADITATGARSLGEYLHRRRLAGQTVRVRKSGSGKDLAYAIYPARDMLEREFDAMWSRQAAHLGLTDADRDAVRHRIFDQRPLKPVIPGKCTFLPDQPRAAKAQPLAQRFEIVQKVNNLRYRRSGDGQQCLGLAQRTLLIDTLARQGEMTFPAIRRLLGLPRNDCWFNLESEKVKKLPGSPTAARLSEAGRFGEAWWALSPAEQQEIVGEIQSPKDTGAVAGWLSERFGLDAETADKTARTRLPQGHVRLSLAALARIVPVMEGYSNEVRR